jgi:lipid-A-disaccharide synthase
VARVSRLVISAFPREAEIYRTRYGANAVSYGHPLLDIVSPGDDPQAALRRAGLDPARPVMGLMPGSRRQEVKELTSAMVGAAAIIKKRRPEMQFILPLAAEHVRPLVNEALACAGPDSGIKVLEQERYECLSCCELVMTCSGTATLELALLGVPMIAVYRLDPVSHWVARRVSMTPYVAMPNVLMEKMIVPEIMQYRMSAENFATTALDLLADTGRRGEIRRSLGEIPGHLGEHGALERAAERIMQEAECANTR